MENPMRPIPFITRLRRLSRGLLGAALLTQAMLASAQTLDTRFGPVEVDDNPQRVVTLYEGALDAAVAVGATPLGAVLTRAGAGVADYIQPRVPQIALVGSARETNLEAVIALRPDLILAPPNLSEEQYRLLSAVAPTIVPAVPRYQPDSWRQESRIYARALNRAAEMEAVLAAIDTRIAALRARFVSGMAADARSATLVRWMPQGAMVMSPSLFSTTLLAAAGFEVQDAGIVKPGRPHSSPLSQEKLSLIDRDWLFLATLDAEGQAALDAARQSPAFARLAVVKNDRVVTVDGQIWTSASGPLAAQALLDRLDQLATSLTP
jgi:iron complex transport system substrate-binding protein